MLELLVCPLTYGPLKFDAEREELDFGARPACLSGA
jgi:uncharacterized protein YbaR (Trm112 family)